MAELAAHPFAAGRIDGDEKRQQRNLSSRHAAAFASISLRPPRAARFTAPSANQEITS
jgi:hypothetical protein